MEEELIFLSGIIIHNGAVLSTTINRYCYISCRKLPNFHDCKHRIVYSKIENVKKLDDIEHPSVREVAKWSGIQYGLEIHHDGDLPARSGLGSSSSFTVGLINALLALEEKRISKQSLAMEAINIEQNLIKENVGCQDQIAAAYGGLNLIEFKKDGNFDVQPLILPQRKQQLLNEKLMLFFTGTSRISSEIALSTIQNLKKKEKIFHKLYDLLWEGLDIIESNNDIDDFGRLLHESWSYKKEITDLISNDHINRIYDLGIKNGALGGKILGSGGGGFILFFVPKEKQENLKKVFSNLTYVPFKFENSGSKVVVYEPKGF